MIQLILTLHSMVDSSQDHDRIFEQDLLHFSCSEVMSLTRAVLTETFARGRYRPSWFLFAEGGLQTTLANDLGGLSRG
jgi:hypothetical protein